MVDELFGCNCIKFRIRNAGDPCKSGQFLMCSSSIRFQYDRKEYGIGNVLGAGGAATAIQVQLALDGAKEINIFSIQDKFFERAKGTQAKLAEKCPECVVTVDDLDDKAKLEAAAKTCDILVNATIMGMKPHEDVTLVDKSLFRKDLVVADTVYNPEKTKMIVEAEEAGCKAIGGVGMLQQQGAVNYELFVGKEMPLAEYQEFQKAQAK